MSGKRERERIEAVVYGRSMEGEEKEVDENRQVLRGEFGEFIADSLQAIAYEGQDKNPEMCRVLLTHEV